MGRVNDLARDPFTLELVEEIVDKLGIVMPRNLNGHEPYFGVVRVEATVKNSRVSNVKVIPEQSFQVDSH
jgi:hypothetical protein